MRHLELCIDANDPGRLRPFWALALGYREEPKSDGSIDLVDPDGRGPSIWFQPVPEAKSAKNRIHLDIFVGRGQRTGLVDALVALGGSVLRDLPDYTVLADPEGNELCVNDRGGWSPA